MVTTIYTDCAHCGATFGQPYDPGHRRQYCSGRCRTAGYRARQRRQQQADRERQQNEERARRQAHDDARRQRERARQRASQPPPHAGSARPGAWCGACGGLRGAHTVHHDDAAHQRARRRYEGLRAKAASTGFPHEATACHAKAEQLRAKYGLL